MTGSHRSAAAYGETSARRMHLQARDDWDLKKAVEGQAVFC